MRKSKMLSIVTLILVFCFVLSAGFVTALANEIPCEGQASGHSVSGDLCDPDYNTCTGGFTVPNCYCTECWIAIDENGNVVEPVEGTGVHQRSDELWPADYLECIGGYPEDYYHCVGCFTPLDA